ncbi:hypothetical protein BVC93_24770 [Mycobacterium sp. MS1601]|nr:hypothetical protein BVC93_24770 [Mycobacterium sp. MS1601]
MMGIIQQLGIGADLDDILEQICVAVVDIIGFQAVAINVVTGSGELRVRTVLGPPELESLVGGTLSQEGWLSLLDDSEPWGELRFRRSPELDESVPHVDPWQQRLAAHPPSSVPAEVEPWRPEFALLVPLWRSGHLRDLLGVISVDLPRSGLTPDFQQRALLELFGKQAAAAISRVHAFDLATDKANLYREAFVASPAPMLVLDSDLCVTDANTAFTDMSDAISDEVLGHSIADLVALHDFNQTKASLQTLGIHDEALVADECALLHPRGHAWDRWVQVQARRVDSGESGRHYVCLIADRTNVRQSMNALRQRADYDQLTGLYLRAVGMDHLNAWCLSVGEDLAQQDPQTSLAVLYCDLDNFKHVNDTDGHRAGDDVLVEVAHRLRQFTDPSDIVCRWGGDEFVLIVRRRGMKAIVDLAHRLVAAVQALAAAAATGTATRILALSIGIAEFTPPADPAAVLEAADGALYRAKNDAHQRVHLHTQ